MHPHSTPTKICSKCKEHKPATSEHFVKSKVSSDGLYCYCKPCAYAIHREYRMAHGQQIAEQKRRTRQASKPKNAAYARKWKAAHPERTKELSKKWRDQNKEDLKERNRKWREANREENAERHRAYYEQNKEEIIQKSREYAIANKERRAKQMREWRIANYARVVAYGRIRRAQKLNAQGTHTGDDIKRQYKAQKGLCYYCHNHVGDTYHVDHVVPLSRGGSNDPENLVIACPACNLSKNKRLPHEWPQGGRLL